MPLIYIILVNYKSTEDTIECINSLQKVTYKNFKIVVIENGSQDDSYERLLELFPQNIIIKSNENLGFAGGNNIGIDYALKNDGEYILLLNNDTIVKSDFLENMLAGFNLCSEVGIVGSKINYFNQPEMISYGGGEINWKKFKTEFYRADQLDNIKEEIREITFISGCSMMINCEVIEKIGFLDDSYFMYYEDTDFCAKAMEFGYKLIYQPNAIVYHKVSKSSGGNLSPFVLYWSTKNRLKFKEKFKFKVNTKQLLMFEVFFYVTRTIRVIDYIFKFKFKEAKAILSQS